MHIYVYLYKSLICISIIFCVTPENKGQSKTENKAEIEDNTGIIKTYL